MLKIAKKKCASFLSTNKINAFEVVKIGFKLHSRSLCSDFTKMKNPQLF